MLLKSNVAKNKIEMRILELSKGLSKIGAKIIEGVRFKLRTSKSPFSFLDKHWHRSHFVCTCILFATCTRK